MTKAQQNTFTWVLIALGACVLIWLLAPVLSPFITAWVLAFATEPVVASMARRHVPRALGALLVQLGFFLGALAVGLVVLPIIHDQGPKVYTELPDLLEQALEALAPKLQGWGLSLPADLVSLKASLVHLLGGQLSNVGATLLNSLRIGGGAALAVVGHLVLVPLVWFYLLIDWPELGPKFVDLVPERFRAGSAALVHECSHMLGQYLRGQLLVMAILAFYYGLGLRLFGFELAWPIGLFTGMVYFVPYLGFGLGLLMATLAGCLQYWPLEHSLSYPLIAVAAVFGGGQIFEGFFLTPRLVGRRIGLHPIAVLFALLAFGQLLGFVGVLLALPLSAVGVVILRNALRIYHQSGFYQGPGARSS